MKEELSALKDVELLGQQFKVYGTFENPLILAQDVAKMIEHSDVSMMVKNIDDDEKLIQALFVSGQRRDCLFLREFGVYEVLMQSRKPLAKQFKLGVKNILREIRTTGQYITPQKKRLLSESNVRAKFCAIECVARVAHLSPSSVTMMCNSVLEHMELPLIDYTPAVDVKKSASDLLTQFGHPESAIAFNKKLVEQGYLKEESYTGSNGKPKKYKALTDKGLEYGENDAPKENPNKIQVHFYENKFEELYSLVYPQQELPFPPSE